MRFKVINGKLDNPSPLVAAIQRYDGKEISIEVKEYSKQRSSPQSRYYQKCILTVVWCHIVEGGGKKVTKGQVHTYLMGVVCGHTEWNPLTGKEEVLSSTILNKSDWELFMEAIRAFFADPDNPFGQLMLMLPNEYT